jgi:hypothetical protein
MQFGMSYGQSPPNETQQESQFHHFNNNILGWVVLPEYMEFGPGYLGRGLQAETGHNVFACARRSS